MLFMLFYLIIYFFLSRSLLSHHIPKRQKKTNPKSKLQNPDQKACLPWGRRKRFVPKGLPLILMKKLGCLPHVFFHVFSCHQSCVVFFSVRLIGFPITSQNALKKIARVPPRGPFPHVVNRISPLWAMYFFYSSSFILLLLFLICMHLFFICLFCMFFVFFYLFCFCAAHGFPITFQNVKKKQIQNPNSKTQIKKRVCPGANAKASSRKAYH